ncbi:DUF6838 family protein [Anaerotruncus massiliensis (ex Togo et al. 2019)]|jgi:hypothetical protein|nr:hypothetical protein [Anaerotruncus massiliensis (ex Togo et al. 2019)]DAY16390.1 MAG TPA: hypothetical protein [Caudoviricetes sp.]
MNVNVKPDAALKKKLAARTLTIPDRVLLALAEAAAGLLPEAAVYTGPIRQDAKLPALFVGFYEIHNAQKLDDLSEYTFGFDLVYWPADSRSDTELRGALYALNSGLHRLPWEDEEYVVYRKNGAVTDRVAHITGIVRALEQTVPDDPYIEKAKKEVTI